jgi:glutathione S-transferase
MITISAFQWVPRFAQGQVRDLRVRWALEEADLPYNTRLLEQGLLPEDAKARARAVQWLIAALNSIEPFAMNLAAIDLFYADEEWAKLRRPGAEAFAQRRLEALSKALGDKPYLDGDRFTAGDWMMTTVLRILGHTDIVTSDDRLAAYVERCTARPAFERALEAQLGDFRQAA